MIPSRLNLLSPTKQKYLRKMFYFQFVKNLLEIFLIIISISGIVLLGGQHVLQSYLYELTGTMATMQSQHKETNRKIKNINSVLIKTDKIQEAYKPATHFTTEVSNVIPEKIILNSLSIDLEKNQISIAGTSPTRDLLLELQTNLEKIDWLQDAYIPLSQLTQKENINFAFGIEIIR